MYKFIDPSIHINEYYSKKKIISRDCDKSENSCDIMYSYSPDQDSCTTAVSRFFENFKQDSILKDINYDAVSSVNKIRDNTIAFYFKSCKESKEPTKVINPVTGDVIEKDIKHKCGFAHAARYIEKYDVWTSDVWSSKLGHDYLISHGIYDLEGDTYGKILCYMQPDFNNDTTDL